MKKKLISLISLALVMGMSACGGSSSSPAPSSQAPGSSAAPASSVTPSSETPSSVTPSSSVAPSSSKKESSSVAPSSKAETVTVTFDGNGAIYDPDPVEVEKGQPVEQPEDPIRYGRKLVCWMLGEEEYDFATPVTEAITLKAEWALDVDPVLQDRRLADLNPSAITDLCVFDGNSPFELTLTPGEHWYLNGDMIVDWKTFCIYDAEGRLCYGIWCPGGGYGVPKEFTYAHHFMYSAQRGGYADNPAFVFEGESWKIVIPEGGICVSADNEAPSGRSWIIQSISNGEYNDLDDQVIADDIIGYAFDAPNCQWSNTGMKWNAEDGCVEAYKLATSLTFEGTKNGIAEGNAETGEYTVEISFLKNNKARLKYDGGYRTSFINYEKYTIVGDYNDTHEDDGTNRLYTLEKDDEEDGATFVSPKGGDFEFVYNCNTKTLTITMKSAPVGPQVVYEAIPMGIDSDAQLSMWTENKVLHSRDGWVGNGWRFYLVADGEGKITYFCVYPPNGYGGPKSTSYNRHSDYSNYLNNPSLSLDPDYADWPDAGHNYWNLKVPAGGIALTGYDAALNEIISVITNGEYSEYDDSIIGELNKITEYCSYLTLKYDDDSGKVQIIEDIPVATVLGGHKDSPDGTLPGVYDDQTTVLDDVKYLDGYKYMIAVDANGTIIYASYHDDGYGGPADGFYHDGNYTCVPGQICGPFNVWSTFKSWNDCGGVGNLWEEYNLQVPTGGYIIIGNQAQMTLLINEVFGVDIAEYQTNVFFETMVEDGEVNDVKLEIKVNAEDQSLFDIVVK